MDPATGTYALVNGRDYRLEPLGTGWVLERFPATSLAVGAEHAPPRPGRERSEVT